MKFGQEETFELTADHIKLMRRMYVDWEDCEYGAPAIDCKRPYGNSSVARDIAEILGWPDLDLDDELPKRTKDEARYIHDQMQDALQIVLAAGSFELGTYRHDRWSSEWTRVVIA